jgi:hypothetical protein
MLFGFDRNGDVEFDTRAPSFLGRVMPLVEVQHDLFYKGL